MRPASGRIAAAQAARLARTRLTGISHATKKRRVRRAAIVADRIWCRWQVGVWQWRLKHIRWLCEYSLRDQSPNTSYQYWLAVRDLLSVLGREHWINQLRGPWTRPN
jgi:hypothetical protein